MEDTISQEQRNIIFKNSEHYQTLKNNGPSTVIYVGFGKTRDLYEIYLSIDLTKTYNMSFSRFKYIEINESCHAFTTLSKATLRSLKNVL